MTQTRFIVLGTGLWLLAARGAFADLSRGIASFEAHRWIEATGEFLSVLQNDPRNERAREYLVLSVRQMQTQQASRNREMGEEILSDASRRLENNYRDASALQNAIQESKESRVKEMENQEHAECLIALMEERQGNLPAANDRVLRVLVQNPKNVEAQRILTDLQSAIHQALGTKTLSTSDTAVLEGFYAFGQADYETAAAAWGRARGILAESFSGNFLAAEVARLHFDSYDKIARQHLEEEREVLRVRSLFTEGLDAFEKGDVAKSLDSFRQVALANPEYPQLGFYLVQSEAAAQKLRTKDLPEDKRNQASKAFARGMTGLEHGQYEEAKKSFAEVLSLDPSHPQAKTYLQQIHTQEEHRTDPVASQEHYEAGLLAYAGGNQEEAVREWHIAVRLDPDNQKTVAALHRVERETEIAKEIP